MSTLFRLAILATCLLSLCSCTGEDPQPELKDPIYQDLVKKHLLHLKSIDEIKKQLDGVNSQLEQAQPRSLEQKNLQNELFKLKYNLNQAIQMEEYFKIQSELRRVEGRRSYKIAYREGKDWPDPKEYEAYKKNIKLQSASRNWNDRVPKFEQLFENAEAVGDSK